MGERAAPGAHRYDQAGTRPSAYRQLRAGIRLRPRQRLLYGLVQFYYPSVGATVLLGTVATAVYLLLGITVVRVNSAEWLALWSASMASWLLLWLWLRRFNLAAHERRETGFTGMLLALFAGPVYVAAGFSAMLRRPLTYAVTAKGNLRSADSLRTFRLHVIWAALAGGLLFVSFRFHHDYIMTNSGPYDFTDLDKFTSAVGQQPSVYEFGQGWAVNQFSASAIDAVARRGMLPLISWEPWDYRTAPMGTSSQGDQFEFGLDCLLDGVMARLSAAPRPGSVLRAPGHRADT